MDSLTLTQLRAFVATVRTGRVSSAAVELNLTQSAVSHALRHLEGHLGVTLLHRGGRGMTLTATGERLLPLAEQLLFQLRALEAAAQAEASLSGIVRIASFPSLTRHLVPRALPLIQAQLPGVQIRVNDAYLDRPAVYDAVRRGEADIGLTQVWPSQGLAVHVLGADPYLLVMPAGWPAADVWSRPYIHLGSPHDRQIPDALVRHGVRLHPALSLATEQAILALVAQQLGFAILPALALTEVPAGVSVQALPWPVQRSYGAVTCRDVPAAVQRVLTLILRTGSEVPAPTITSR
ncbi:LysR family transcriptional regulator [Deinococcus humi]|uniref:DNA-binding transcriptional LysR family regulator n=1 Tax=Deinococcus humi TaxID=662880 RepID=A0A7W8JV32_9DEIO|nr:LysR family transcriptional regulator [Deinococcus humi]MBB5363679.1 DNA-binding transcriptional LysR family regulator [Deinococcus humi]GGO29801.1 LysR family transcriptional regulator [Deinococcus humi]